MPNFDSLLTSVFYLLPGFLALRVYEWFVGTRERSVFELTCWSVALSLLAAGPFVAIPMTQGLMSYLWGPKTLSPAYLIGFSLHVGAALLVGVGAAAFVVRFKGRIARLSSYRRGWDWLWGCFGDEDRFVEVQTDSDRILGVLAFADDPTSGTDIIVQHPAVWDDQGDGFFRTGMRWMWIPGARIRRVQVSVSNPPTKDDLPLPERGFIQSPQEDHSNGRPEEAVATADEG